MRREAAFASMVVLLAACAGRGAPSTAPTDAASPPASAFAECTPTGPHDASTFLYTATCSFPADDAGGVTSCQQWSESDDGDWTPFLDSCEGAGGAITATPCSDAAVTGVCVLPASCTTQTSIFQYGDLDAASASCAAMIGATFVP